MRLKEIEFCMQRKCKVCEKYLTCDLKYKQKDVLTYRPFENLKEIMENKSNGDSPRQHNIHK